MKRKRVEVKRKTTPACGKTPTVTPTPFLMLVYNKRWAGFLCQGKQTNKKSRGHHAKQDKSDTERKKTSQSHLYMETNIVKPIEAGSRMMDMRARGGENRRCRSNGMKFQLHWMNEFWALRYSMVATVNSAALYT